MEWNEAPDGAEQKNGPKSSWCNRIVYKNAAADANGGGREGENQEAELHYVSSGWHFILVAVFR